MTTTQQIRSEVLAGKPFCLKGMQYDYRIGYNELIISNGNRTVARCEIHQITEDYFITEDYYLPSYTGKVFFKDCDLKQPIN